MKLEIEGKHNIKRLKDVFRTLSDLRSTEGLVSFAGDGIRIHLYNHSATAFADVTILSGDECSVEAGGSSQYAIPIGDVYDTIKALKNSESLDFKFEENHVYISDDDENPTQVEIRLLDEERVRNSMDISVDVEAVTEDHTVALSSTKSSIKGLVDVARTFDKEATMIFERAEDGKSFVLRSEGNNMTENRVIKKVEGDVEHIGDDSDFQARYKASIMTKLMRLFGSGEIEVKMETHQPIYFGQKDGIFDVKALVAPKIPE